MMGAIGGIAAAVGLLLVGTHVWIGEPDRHIDFFADHQITCWWDNIDGFAWCALVATGDERCSWHVDFWDEKMGREDIPARCWPVVNQAEPEGPAECQCTGHKRDYCGRPSVGNTGFCQDCPDSSNIAEADR